MDNYSHLMLTSIMFLFCFIIYFIQIYKTRSKIDSLDPFILISSLYFLIFVLAPLVWISRGQTGYQGIEVMKYLPRGNGIFILGYVIFVFGSYIGRKNRKCFIKKYVISKNENLEYKNSEILLYGIFVFSCSIILGLLYYKMQGKSLVYMLTFGQLSEELSVNSTSLSFLFLSCFIRSSIPGLLILIAFSNRNRFLLIFLSIVTILITVTTGSRNLTITTVLSIMVYIYLSRKERPKIYNIILALVIFYLFVGFVGVFRKDILTGGDIVLSKINSNSFFTAFMYNIEIFFPFYNLVEVIPKYAPYHYGLGFLNIFVQFIPRAIWPDKPAMLGTSSLSVIYGSSFGGAAYPNIGSFYYEFGVLGVVILMYLFGYFTQKKYWIGIYSNEKFRNIQFAMMFGYLIQFVCRSSISAWAIDIVFMFGPIWFIKKRYGIKS